MLCSFFWLTIFNIASSNSILSSNLTKIPVSSFSLIRSLLAAIQSAAITGNPERIDSIITFGIPPDGPT